MSATQTTNYQKFQTKNPLVQKLFTRFYNSIAGILQPLGAQSVLDAGCGEGETEERLQDILPEKVDGFDINPDCVEFTKERHPRWGFSVQDIFNLPYEDSSYDAVICLEVLEHLENPGDALVELLRVSRSDVIVSVPHEPWFRLSTFCAGQYIKNTTRNMFNSGPRQVSGAFFPERRRCSK